MSERKNPFDDLFDQIHQLLHFVQNHTLVPTEENSIPPDIEKRLESLQKKIISFNRLSEDIVKLSGVSDEELKLRLAGTSKELPEEGKELIERSHEIKAEAEKVNDKLEKQLKHLPSNERALSAQAETPKDKMVGDAEYAKKRRSKFKRFGGDQKWKPL